MLLLCYWKVKLENTVLSSRNKDKQSHFTPHYCISYYHSLPPLTCLLSVVFLAASLTFWTVSTDLFSIPLGLRDTLLFFPLFSFPWLLKVLPYKNFIPWKSPVPQGRGEEWQKSCMLLVPWNEKPQGRCLRDQGFSNPIALEGWKEGSTSVQTDQELSHMGDIAVSSELYFDCSLQDTTAEL